MSYLSFTSRIKAHANFLTDKCVATAFTGWEHVSEPFLFKLKIISPNIVDEQCLGQTIAVELQILNDLRYFHGICYKIVSLPQQSLERYECQIEIIPWLKLLDLKQDCRIFQQQNIVEIVKYICHESGFFDVEFYLHEKYEPIEYCVQYNESTLHFISRLLEFYGIFYYFRHEQNRHVLIITDQTLSSLMGPMALYCNQNSSSENYLSHWQRIITCQTSKMMQTDYCFKAPQQDLTCAAENQNPLPFARQNGFQHYFYPGGYNTRFAGNQSCKRMMEAHATNQIVFQGEGTYLVFQPGMKFTLANAIENHQEYFITKIFHEFYDRSYLTHPNSVRENPGQLYMNRFCCVPCEIPYRPSPTHAKPMIAGHQTAKVVQQVYTDRFGRIKVQFHWDRRGQNNEKSSCWLRTTQWWAGDGYGTQWIPRVGQEVIVEFLNGDPDDPIVTGVVPNAENLPIYSLPENIKLSGFKTASIGASHSGNELTFNDALGEEEILLSAKRDLKLTVEKDHLVQIGNEERVRVLQGGQWIEVQGQYNLSAKKGVEYRVGQNYLKINPDKIEIAGDEIKINSKEQR